jgi:hypothetical protein
VDVMPATTHIINWKSGVDTTKPPLTIITAPDSIVAGDEITISLYSATQYNLLSPYNGLSSKTIASANPSIDEVIELSGSAEINAKYPVASLVSAIAAIPLVDELTHKVVINAGQPLGALVSVVNQRLVINSTLKLHGGIQAVYNTFPAQQWTHKPFAKKCSALLFAQNTVDLSYENVPLSIGERSSSTNDSIRIEGYPIVYHFSTNPYAGFIVFPARANAIVKADYGWVVKRPDISYLIEREKVTFAGKTANAAFFIDKKLTFTGYFFNAKHEVVIPKFTVSAGNLASDIDCYGTGFLTYETLGTVYDYNAQITVDNTGPFGSWLTVVGNVFAFDPEKVGIAATYEIPLNTIGENLTREIMIEVYREVLVVGKDIFEVPDGTPAYPDGNNYTHYSGLPDNQKPPLGEAYAVTRWVHESVFIINGAVNHEFEVVNWSLPASDADPFLGVVYKMTDKIPTTSSLDYPQQVLDELNKEKADLIVKYNIV